MKKLLFILISTIFLFGCGTSGSPNSEQSFDVVEASAPMEESYEFVFDEDEEMAEESMPFMEERGIDENEEFYPLASQLAEDTTMYLAMLEITDEFPDEPMDESLSVVEPIIQEPRGQENTLVHQHDLPPNALIFPHYETGYDWQASDEFSENSIWVGIVVSERPNKLGNFSYDVYMTSNTLLNVDIIANVVVGGIDILYYSPEEYLNTRSNDKRTLQSKQDFKQQIIKEVEESEDKDHLFNHLRDFKQPTLIITHEQILVHTFFLPDTESEIVVMWEYIKKLDK